MRGFLSAKSLNRTRLLVTRETLVLLLYMAAGAMALNVFMQTRSFEEGSKQFGLAAMLAGEAERPFVYRQLLPIVANFVVERIPAAEREAFVQYHLDRYHLKQRYFEKARYPNKNSEIWTPSYAIAFHVVYVINFLSLLGLAYLLRFLLKRIVRAEEWLALVAPMFFLLFLPLSFMHGNFFYDIPELFFLAGLLLAAVKGKYLWWVLLLPLAVLNKESNVLVPLLYAPVIAITLKGKNKIFFACSAILLSLLGYFYIKNQFFDNLGGTTSWHLWENIRFWLAPGNYFLWHDFYVPMIPFPRGINFLFLGILISLLAFAWRNITPLLKGLLLMALTVNLPLWLAFCYRDEMRNLSFVFLPIFLIASYAFSILVSEKMRP